MCTDVLIMSETKDQVVNARSQEFSEPLGYRVMFRKKGVMVKLTLPTKCPDVAMPTVEALANPTTVFFGESRYDYMGIIMTTVGDKDGVKSGTAISTSVFDGMNSAGLSAGSLNFPGASYQPPKEAGTGTENVFVGFFVDWMLSNFATCEEIKTAFKEDRVRVVAQNTAGFDEREAEAAVHQHYAVHDAKGNSLVIEFIDNKAVVTDNPIGVMTNLPVFSWHLTNLGLYTRLTNFSTTHDEAANFDGVIYGPPGSATPEAFDKKTPPSPQYFSTGIPGMGDGLIGIPGDFRPPSRFVRTAYMKKFAVPPTTASEAVSEGFHLLNGVDMVKGASAERANGVTKYDTAQIIFVKDLANKKFYLRMYESPMPYVIPFDGCPHFAAGSSNSPDGVEIAIPVHELAQPLSV